LVILTAWAARLVQVDWDAMTGCFGEFDVAPDGGFNDQLWEGLSDFTRYLLIE